MRQSRLPALMLLLVACEPAFAQTAAEKIPLKPEVVLSGLDNPTAVAIQPTTGTVFVANSAAGEVIRVVDGKAERVITDFPLGTYGKDPVYKIGPLGLAFLDQHTLVVGGGGKPDGEELLRVYKVPPLGALIKADQTLHSFGPIKPKPDVSASGEGNFYGVAVAENAIYATSNGDDTKGWIARVKLKDGKPFGELEPYIATKRAVGVDAPVGITLTANGHLLVGQMGEIDKASDSRVSFYSRADGKELLSLATGLYDIAGLTYSRNTGLLYAVDFAWMKSESAGLYRLDRAFVDERQACKAALIAKFDKPTALAFGTKGELYVTVFGTAKEGDATKPGKLIKFAKGL